MAYQARGRDPLLDSNMAEAIEQRGKELLGLILIVLGCMVAAMIVSYSPDDPSWMSATEAPVNNWMGSLGASIAAPMFMIVGLGGWALALILVAWGIRFALHKGEERAINRLIFAPIAIALGSVYASTLVPGAGWTHSFGLGGLFGDTVLGTVLNILPIGATIGLKAISILMGLAIVGFATFILGFTIPEIRHITRFMVVGVIMVYATLMTQLGRGASGAVQAAQNAQARQQERRAARQAEASHVTYAEPVLSQDGQDYAPELFEAPEEEVVETVKSGLLSRMPGLIRRASEPMPEPELVVPEAHVEGIEAPEEERIKSKISEAIRSRVQRSPEPQEEPSIEEILPLTRGLGRKPDPLVLNAVPSQELPAEPPLTAPQDMGRAEPPLTMSLQPQSTNLVPEAPAFEQIEEFVEADPLPLQDMVAESEPLAQMQPLPAAEPKKVVQPRQRKQVQPSQRAKAEAQPSLAFEDNPVEYELPPLSLLTNPRDIQRHHLSDDALEENARMLESVLDDYGVKGEIVSVRPGPVVTMYELEPAPGLKASRVIGLADDIARSMSALSARVSTVPGRSVIGIELPNEFREKVVLREILAARDFGDSNMSLPMALGKDIGGDAVVANLAKMPHLLIAGTTGSGKSVAINTMILSLLYKLTPDECRLIMIDPKMLELSVYDGIPHLLSPVVTDPKKAVVALKWVVGEMEERYRKMSKMGVRNIEGYNGRVRDALLKNEMFSRTVQTGFDEDTGEPVFETEEIQPVKLPYIVVVVDEMADLMMVAGKEIEACIQRLAQMARASGIHLIMATQRPSVDVITGTIKANFPTRISFQVTSKVDSRTILGEMGAEQLLGMGDMLYMAGGAKITRCHGPFVSDEEVEEIVTYLKAFGPPDYVGGVIDGPDEDKESDIDLVLGLGGNTDGEDALYDQAVAIVIKDRKCSTSYIQRKLSIGYNKAARLVEQMEDEGLVSAANHVGKREILVPEQA